MSEADSEGKPSVKERLKEELVKYALVTAYLYLCFIVLLLWKAAVLQQHGIDALHYGTAIIKALVLGKFILIGDAIKFGTRKMGPTMLHRIVRRTVAMFVILLALTGLEEWLVGLAHGKSLAQTWAEFTSNSLLENLAPDLVMLLILVPLIAASELRKTLGSETIKRQLLARDDAGSAQ